MRSFGSRGQDFDNGGFSRLDLSDISDRQDRRIKNSPVVSELLGFDTGGGLKIDIVDSLLDINKYDFPPKQIQQARDQRGAGID